MVSLPSKWIKQNSLDKGSEIDLLEQDNKITITSSSRENEKKSGIINITPENKDDVKGILTHAYRKGFDKITIIGADQKTKDVIKTTTKNNLMGFEVVDIKLDKCVIENISEPDENKYDTLLRRTFLIIKETYNLLLQDIEQKKQLNESSIEDLKDQQDRILLFCKRLLHKEKINIFIDWELLTFLMHIEHLLHYMSNYYYTNKPNLSKNFIDLFKEYSNYLELFTNAQVKQDINLIHKLSAGKKQFQFGRCLTLLEQSKGKETVMSSYLRELFRLTQISSSPVFAELVDKYVVD